MAKMTRQELERTKRLAEKLKGKPGINPHAVARAQVQKRRRPPPKPRY